MDTTQTEDWDLCDDTTELPIRDPMSAEKTELTQESLCVEDENFDGVCTKGINPESRSLDLNLISAKKLKQSGMNKKTGKKERIEKGTKGLNQESHSLDLGLPNVQIGKFIS